jgi:hypothetical protein
MLAPLQTVEPWQDFLWERRFMFFLGVAFRGLGFNNSIILTAISYARGKDMYHIFRNTIGNLIARDGVIPGSWVTVAACDAFDCKPL